jgi:hypothetical protein
MATAEETAAPPSAPKQYVGEWFWRFLALVMLATVGWVVWIIYQISPQPLVTEAAFKAAAKAKAASQDAKGLITPAAPPAAAPPGAAPVAAAAGAAEAAAPAPKPAAETPPPAPKEPPVNVERLRLADTIETPIPERGKKK